jgi:hypothetical protein
MRSMLYRWVLVGGILTGFFGAPVLPMLEPAVAKADEVAKKGKKGKKKKGKGKKKGKNKKGKKKSKTKVNA